MGRAWERIRRILLPEDRPGPLEYAVILGVVVLLAGVAYLVFGQQVSEVLLTRSQGV